MRSTFRGNGGEVNNISNGPNDTSLTADPVVDSASGDFNLNENDPGGQTLRDKILSLDANSDQVPFGGWALPPAGGGGLLRVGMNGGFDG